MSGQSKGSEGLVLSRNDQLGGEASGLDLIERFESGAIEPGNFHHADHVRLAFEYLLRYSVLVALERFPAALKRFAAAHGKTQLYHETITWAYLLLMHERMERGGEREWERFAEGNQDLLAWKGGVLQKFYSEGMLNSEIARRIFVFPDRV